MSKKIMNIEKNEIEIEIDYSDTKKLNFYDCGSRDKFDMLEIVCPKCNKKSYIHGYYDYGFGMYFSCNACETQIEFDDSEVDVIVYAKFTNLKSLKVSRIYNYNDDNDDDYVYDNDYNDDNDYSD